MDLGTPELILILAIVFLVFGVGRISKIGSELGQGIRSFREGLNGPKEAEETVHTHDKTARPNSSSPTNDDDTYAG